MKIFLGSDHGGFDLKIEFSSYLMDNNPEFEIEDLGAFALNEEDDYPLISFQVAEKVSQNSENGSLGILLCRSGSGVVIAANKVKGIRAVELYDEKIAKQAKSHNRANVIAFGADYISLNQLIKLFETFIQSEIDSDTRHQRRIKQISDYENNKSA